MHFVDEVRIYVKAGNGGRGCISFRREKYVPHGGPHGGDGGRGGHIILKATSPLHTLYDFKYHHQFRAKRGQHGKGKRQKGKDAKDLIIKVPLGTTVKDVETGTILADLIKDGQEVTIAKGGRGGRGNWHFATPTNQAPRYVEPEEKGEDHSLLLELKIIADVALVGEPNVGKSSLVTALSRARPKIAQYPFTTLHPQLGIVEVKDYFCFVVVEVPGLLEGAHKGIGLGSRFLRHIERSLIIAYVLDISKIEPKTPLKGLEKLKDELRAYNPSLLTKPQVVIINKIDLFQAKNFFPLLKKALDETKLAYWFVSALTKDGIESLKEEIGERLNETKGKPSRTKEIYI